MNKTCLFSAVVLSFLFISCAVSHYTSEISRDDIYKHISVLASDELQGRLAGSEGDRNADEYIREQLETVGLISNRQEFGFLKSLSRGNNNYLIYNGVSMGDSDFTPCSFSYDTCLTAALTFAGYGMTIKSDSVSWDDYRELDVRNKWVMVLTGYPDIPAYSDYFETVCADRDKAMLALDKGAAGVLFVSGSNEGDTLAHVFLKQADVSMPCFQIRRHMADSILGSCNETIDGVIQKVMQRKYPYGLSTESIVEGNAHVEKEFGVTGNRYAILEGSDASLKDQYIIIGAHYDHIGFGGKGSGSRIQDTVAVHNGADDNASGVSVLLELAARLQAEKDQIRRSLIFVAFGAEELGLLGSKYFIQHLPVSLEQVTGMINLDMVRRFDTIKGLQVGGAGTSLQGDSIIRFANQDNLKLRITPEGNGPSDHAAFYSRSIPVFYLTTGAHTDYHTPFDDPEYIHFNGLKLVSDFTERLIVAIANTSEPLVFRESGSRETDNPARRFKVTLGFMPDFSATDIEGVRVELVSKGKAAERAGIINGDIIVGIDGTKVRNIYDYMYRLSHLKKNQIISVEILRNGISEVFIVQL